MTEYLINKTIRVVTTFSYTSRADAERTPVISYELYYPVCQQRPLMTGLLAGDNKQVVKCKSPDGYVHGYLQTTVSEDEMVLLGNLFYGVSSNQALQSHFDGTIAIYLLREPPVPPVPPPPPGESTEDLEPGMAIGAPLFPYIDVQPWPATAIAMQPFQFFSYDSTNAPGNSLYSLLRPLATAKDRAGMEALTILFLQEQTSFAGQYFGSLNNVPAPFNRFPAIYDLLWNNDRKRHYGELLLEMVEYESIDLFITSLLQNDYEQVKDQVWQNYFALTIFAGYAEHFFIDINKILLIINLIDTMYSPEVAALPEHHLQTLLQATVILPDSVFPLPPYKEHTIALNRVIPYAIGRLKMTRYHLQSYSLGEIAQIENVLKGEKKKVIRRSLTRQSEQTEQHNHNSNEQNGQSDQTTHELLTEVHKTVAALTKQISFNNLTVSYGPPTQAIYNGTGTETFTAGAPGKEQSNNFASTVLNKTLNRIQEAVLRSRTFYSFKENEEIQTSLFDNHNGQHNFRGIYRWVNKVYRISVENYGYRFLLVLEMKDPANSFIVSQQALNNTNLQRPLSPFQQKINSFLDITPENYVALLTYYQVAKVLLPPEPAFTTGITITQSEPEKYITVPSGYIAASAKLAGVLVSGVGVTEITGIIGAKHFTITTPGPQQEHVTLDNETGQVAIAVNSMNIPGEPPVTPSNFILNATVTCSVSDNKVNEWKIAVYNEIVAAWQRLMQQYDDNITRFARGDQQTNPLLLNNIERSALYNNSINMLLEVQAEKVGKGEVAGPLLQQVNIQRYRQFMEEALEWDEMTWRFDDQPPRYSYALQGGDDSLRPFLQATSATVFLPVRPDYNFQVLYYLFTGMLCLSPYPFVPVNSDAVDIATHLKNVPHWRYQRQEEKHWHITLPTAMQVLQEGNQLPIF